MFGGAGDSVIAEFASPVEAVRCAVEFQRDLEKRNAELEEARRMRFRIGVNLGDVMIEGDDLLGDGVNVAARLEALAAPGGICISATVHDHVVGKLDLAFVDLGEKKVKNIKKPIRVYQVLLDSEAPLTTAPPLDLPDKPSIAVLPFENMSGDPEQEYFSDGITEDIITELSMISGLFVIARNSTFTYKGKPVKVQRVAEELGVRYVLAGSVQKSGERIRVTVQLIDAVKGHHMWSERYDRKLTELFTVQDEITQKIVVALQVKLTEGEQARVRHRSTNNLQAWGYAARGLELFGRFTKADNARARELFRQAVALDPQYAYAWTFLAWTHLIDAQFGYSASRAKSSGKAVEIARKALALGPDEPDTHKLMGNSHLLRREYDQAVAEGRKALELGPNMSSINAGVAITMRYVGNWDEAIALGERAVRSSPRVRSWVLQGLGLAYALKGEYTRAVATLEAGLRRAESDAMRSEIHRGLAFAHSEAGQMEKARRHMAQALKLNRRYSSRYVSKITFYKQPAHLKRMLTALRKAGLPE